MATDPRIVTMNVSLPQPLKAYVDDKIASGIYGSASEFVREAIREKLQRDQAKSVLADKLIEGLDSGPPIPFTNSYFKSKKRALIQQYAQADKRHPRRKSA